MLSTLPFWIILGGISPAIYFWRKPSREKSLISVEIWCKIPSWHFSSLMWKAILLLGRVLRPGFNEFMMKVKWSFFVVLTRQARQFRWPKMMNGLLVYKLIIIILRIIICSPARTTEVLIIQDPHWVINVWLLSYGKYILQNDLITPNVLYFSAREKLHHLHTNSIGWRTSFVSNEPVKQLQAYWKPVS